MSERRWPWIVLCCGALAAFGALALATVAALRLEKAEALASAQAKQQESMRLALWRMDSTLAPLIARESARPYFHYEPYYAVDRVITSSKDKAVAGQVLVPSPLQNTPDDLIRLNFACEPEPSQGESLSLAVRVGGAADPNVKEKAPGASAPVPLGKEVASGTPEPRAAETPTTTNARFGQVSSPQLAGEVRDHPRLAGQASSDRESLQLRLDQLSALLAMRPIDELESRTGGFTSELRRSMPAVGGMSPPPSDKAGSSYEKSDDKIALRKYKQDEGLEQESQSLTEYIARQNVVQQHATQSTWTTNNAPSLSVPPATTATSNTPPAGAPRGANADAKRESGRPSADPRGGVNAPQQYGTGGNPKPGAAPAAPASPPAPSTGSGGKVESRVIAGAADSALGAKTRQLDVDAAAKPQAIDSGAQYSFSEPQAVEQTEFRPIWLGDAGNPELVFVRWVTLGSTRSLQGFWVDWPLLRERLLSSIEDLVPESRLTPISDHAPPPNPGRTLAAIPAELRLSAAPVPEVLGWTPVRTTLALTWGAFITALALGAWMLHALSDLAERRGRFVSAVTHELRTPLTTFCLYSQMLADGMVREDEQRAEYLQTLKGESKRLAGIVENVLLFARLSRSSRKAPGTRPPTTSVIDLHERIIPALTRRAVEAGMDLLVEGELEPSTQLTGDAPTIERILLNLVDNACKYAHSADDHRLHLHLSSDGHAVRLTLRDHGPGVNVSERESIFTAFTRSKQHADSPTPGLGLGLALSRGLARELGGELTLLCESPGAAFELRVPRVAPA